MRSSASKIQMKSFNDLFQTDNSAPDAATGEHVQDISLEKLVSFHNHPFQVRDDEEMQKTVESVAQHGILSPAIVRPLEGEKYELISGHRRKRAAELAGLPALPCIVRELTDDEATIIMVDANLQREKLLPSEKGFAYKMKLEALKHQGKRSDLTSAPGEQKLTARDKVAQDAGEKSGSAVARYISLTKLIPPLLALVDDGKMAVSSTADYLSDLPETEQVSLLAVMERLGVVPSKEQMVKIRNRSREGALTETAIDALLSEKKLVFAQVILKKERLMQYFPQSYTMQQIEEVIFSLLEVWQKETLQTESKTE